MSPSFIDANHEALLGLCLMVGLSQEEFGVNEPVKVGLL